MNIFDQLKEAITPQPMINLNNINKQTLPQITQGLQGIVKAQDQLKIQQQKMMQQQQKTTPQPQQMGMKPMSEVDETPAGGSPQGLGPSKGMEPKSLPADPTPTMATPTTPMGMKTMAADSIPILEDGEEETEPDAIKMELEDHIDDLLLTISKYGFSYFKDKSEKPIIRKQDIQGSFFPIKPETKKVPFYQTMSNDQKMSLANDPIIKLLKSGDYERAFTDLIRMKQSMNEQNFVNSKMFSIIAENETPRITKRDFVNHIKKR